MTVTKKKKKNINQERNILGWVWPEMGGATRLGPGGGGEIH